MPHKNASLLYYEPLDSRLVLKYSILPYIPVSPAPCVNNIEGRPPDDYTVKKRLLVFPSPAVMLLIKLSLVHRKDTIPKIRNKYFQKRNCEASVPMPTFMSLSAIYIPTISLPFLLQENRWTDGGNIEIAHKHMNVGLRPSNSFSGNT
jgi:hypothetical protein